MFCMRCGKYNPDTVSECKYCGSKKLSKTQTKRPIENNPSVYGESKTAVGVLMCLFLGLIGLIIGLIIYPTGSHERQTFVSGWVKTIIAAVIISVVIVIMALGCVGMSYPMY